MSPRHERGLKKLPDGRYRVSWCFEGRWIRRKVQNKTQAERLLASVHGQIVEGRYMDVQRTAKTPFAEGVKKFLTWSETNTRPSTHKGDKNFTALWLVSPCFTGKTLDRITPADVEAYKAQRITKARPGAPEGKAPKKVTTKTIDNDLARLKRLFSLCKTWGLCKDNPVLKVKFFKPESRRDRFLTFEEEATLVDAAALELRPAIVFSIHTGLRQMEMLTLTWGDVDMKREEVTITAEKAKGKRTRRVPLDRPAKEALTGLPRSLDPAALVFRVFQGKSCKKTEGGGPTFYTLWRHSVTGASLKGVCWHTLRHTFASRLVMNGVDLVTVQKLLGHSTLAMVLKYAHLAESHMRDAVKTLERYPQNTHTQPEGMDGGGP